MRAGMDVSRTAQKRYRMMKRRNNFTLRIFLLFLLFFPPAWTGAFEVAVVKSAGIAPYVEAMEGFRSACQCTLVEINSPGKGPDSFREAVRRSSAKAVLAIGTEAFRQARSVGDIPVIHLMVQPSELSVAAGRNISGVGMLIPPGRYLDTIARLLPAARRIGVIYDPGNTGQYVNEILAAARQREFEVLTRKVSKPAEVASAVKGLQGRIDLLWLLPDATAASPAAMEHILFFSFQDRVPVVAFARKYVEQGAFAALSVDPFDMGAQAGEISRLIAQNKKTNLPASFPPRTWKVLVNRRIAEKMGISMGKDLPREWEEVSSP